MDTIEKKFIDGEYYVEYNLFNTVFWDNETNKRKAERLEEENKKLKEDVDFFYKSAKQFREQIDRWEKDFVEGRIVEADKN